MIQPEISLPSPLRDKSIFPKVSFRLQRPRFGRRPRVQLYHHTALSGVGSYKRRSPTSSASMSSEGQADGAASSASDAGLKIWSCVICRRRKVRCDRRDPCSNCVRAAIDCHYPVTGRVPRRSRDPSVWKSPAQKQSELLSRLRRLEAVVTELSAQVEEGPGEPSANPTSDQPNPSLSISGNTSSPDTTQSEARFVGQSLTSSASDVLSFIPGSEFDEEFGRLVVDKDGSRHVGNRFWSVFCDEVCPLHVDLAQF